MPSHIRKLLLFSILCFQFKVSLAQPCSAITNINCGITNIFNVPAGSGDASFTNGVGTTCYWSSGTGGGEKIYKFIASQTGTYQLNTTTASSNGYVEYFYKNAQNGCSALGWTCFGYTSSATSLASFNMNAGDSMFVLVNAESNLGVTQNFQISCAIAFACTNVSNISCGVDVTFNVGAGYGDPNYPNGAGGSCYWNSGRGGFEKIYKFVASQTGTYQLNTTTASTNGYVEYFYTKNYNGCSASSWNCFGYTSSATGLASFNMNAGDSMFILVNAESNLGVTQNFQISCATAFACTNVSNISCGVDVTFNVGVGYGDPNYPNGAGGSCYWNSGRGGFEKIYKFVAAQTGTYQLNTTTASTNGYVEYFYTKNYNGCSASSWNCFGYTSSATGLASFNMNAGDSMFILVNAESYLGVTQNFQISCATAFACTNVSNISCGVDVPFTVGAGYGDPNYPNGAGGSCYWNSGRGGFEKIYKFVAAQTGTYQLNTTTASSNGYVEYFYTKNYNGCSASSWNCFGYTSSATGLASFNMNAGDSMFILVNAEGSLGVTQNFQISCATAFACTNVSNISCGVDVTFNVAAGYGDPNYPNGAGGSCYWNSGRGGFEKIYKFVASQTGIYQINTTSNSTNGYVEYFFTKSYNGCNTSSWNCLGYTSSIAALNSITLNAGDSVFILVNAEGTLGVTQNFQISCASALPCSDITSITCGTPVNFVVGSGYGDANYPNGISSSSCRFNSGRGGLSKIYKFKASVSGVYNISTNNATSNGSYIDYLYKSANLSCDNTNWNCLGVANSASNLINLTLNAGDSIYIIAKAESTSGVAQTFTISCAIEVCNTITDISCGTDNVFGVAAGYGNTNYSNGMVVTTCYGTTGIGGLEKIYRFVADKYGYYSLQTVTSSTSLAFVEYFYKKSNNCSPTGWTCFGYTKNANKMDSVLLNKNDTLLILANSESLNGTSQTFRLNCSGFICTVVPKYDFTGVKACGSYTYKGKTYSSNTRFIDTIRTAQNCDSIYRTVVLEVSQTNITPLIVSNNVNPCSSNAVQFTASPYKQKPLVTTPKAGTLYLTGNATSWGWNASVPTYQAFNRIDAYTYVGVFNLIANKNYRLLAENGNWNIAYGQSTNASNTAFAGDFIENGNDFVTPATNGKYKIEINFLTGKYVVTSFNLIIPDSLYITGDALNSGWANPAPVANKLSRVNSVKYELLTILYANKNYLFLPQNGSWANKLAYAYNTTPTRDTGTFAYLSSGGLDFLSPATTGLYKIELDFINSKYKVIPDSLVFREDTSYVFYDYQWYKNSTSNWVGNGTNIYLDSNFNKNDSVWAMVTHNAICTGSATAYTNKIIVPSRLPLNTYQSAQVCANALPYSWNGNNYSAAGSYTYHYTSSSGCDSTSTLVLTVLDTSIVSIATPGTCLSNAVFTASLASNIQQYIWQKNGVNSDTISAITAVTGTTVAGGNVAGFGANTFNNPTNIYVDKNDNIYVVDRDNNRIQKWAKGATSGTTIAGGFGYALSDSAFKTPTGITFDDSGYLYVADFGNHRVMKFDGVNKKGVLVAGGNGAVGSGDYLMNGVAGVAVDGAGNVYVVDQNNHRVQKLLRGAKQGITVAGGNGSGSNANQLITPTGLFVDKAGNVYVCDYGNNRIQKWAAGATTGITVAGGNGSGSNANQLKNPASVYVDISNNIYVADAGNNRIQKWAAGATTGITVAGGNGSGSNANQFKLPMGIFAGADASIYVADQQNTRIQKFASTINKQYTPTVVGDYNIRATNNNGCTSVSNVINIDVPKNPGITISESANNICYGTKVTFNNNITDAGSKYDLIWYKNGIQVASNLTQYIDSVLNNGDSVWCNIKLNSGCVSNSTVKSNVILMQVKHNFSGNIITPLSKTINNVNVIAAGTINSTNLSSVKYSFNCLDANQNAVIKLKKNNDVSKANGVTSVDVLLTQRHILNTTKLNSSYKIIAADVDGNKTINSVDILRMKRLILGTDTTFTSSTKGNRLWEFVDSAYTFPDTTNPFPFKDSISFTNLTSNNTNKTFIGVKLGDVNYDWNPAVARGIAANSLELIVNSEKQTNNNLQLSFSSSNFNNINALQTTLHFDNTKYEFVVIEDGKLQLDYNISKANSTGNIAILWTDKNAEAKSFDKDEVLFTVILKPRSLGIGNLEFVVSNDMVETEAWDNNFAKRNIVLKQTLTNDEQQSPNNLLIYPNPAHTTVGIKLDKLTGTATLVITDVYGKQVLKKVINQSATTIDIAGFTKGVYMISVITEQGKQTQKLVVE